MNASAASQTPRHPKPVIGLLGAPGSGKSTVARQFGKLGCGIIDADALAHDALDEPAIQTQIVAWWGRDMLDSQRRISRRNLAAMVFTQAGELRKLESLLHPRVAEKRAELREIYFADPKITAIVEDCPLLLETGLDADMDALVFIDAPMDIRYARLAASRGWTPEQITAREKNQLPLDSKRARADYVVNNGASETTCLADVTRVLSLLVPTNEHN